jgi:hypothetical protein
MRSATAVEPAAAAAARTALNMAARARLRTVRRVGWFMASPSLICAGGPDGTQLVRRWCPRDRSLSGKERDAGIRGMNSQVR